MARSDSFWLTLTNIMLGAALLLCVLIATLGMLSKTLSNAKKRRSCRAELNHDMQEMFPGGLSPQAVVRAPRPKSTQGLIEAVRADGCTRPGGSGRPGRPDTDEGNGLGAEIPENGLCQRLVGAAVTPRFSMGTKSRVSAPV